jgi:hypothetical protein
MADKENIYGIKYEVDIEELKTSTAEATKKIKLANAEFKESSSKMDNWASSTDGVSAKVKQLTAILDAEKTKLEQLKNSYNNNIDSIEEYDKKIAELKSEKEKAIEQYGKESQEVKSLSQEIAKLERKQDTAINTVDKLKVSILNQQASINKTEREIDNYNSKLNQMQSESTQTVSSMDKLKKSINNQEKELGDLKDEYSNVVLEQGKTSDEAKKLASKIRELNSDLQSNKSKLNTVQKEADELTGSFKDVDEGTEEASGGFTIMKGALADLTANAISKAISKVGEFIGSLFELSDATQEYRVMNAKLEGSANNFGYSVDFAKEQYKEFYGYLKDDQASTNAITNLMGLGTSTENLSQLTKGAIGVWASYGDSIPIESLTEAINETIQVGKVTGTFADTLNWAKISNEQWTDILGKGTKEQKIFSEAIKDGMTNEDAFNEVLAKTTSQKERANIVAKFLNETYGDSKKKYDELTGSITEANKSELALKDSQSKLGKAMEPVNTAINNLKAKALDKIAPVVEMFAQKILDLNEYLKEHPAVAKAVTAVVIALATAFGILATALAIQGIITGVTKAMALLKATFIANPYFLVATAIAGLVAGFIYLWNTSEGFRNFWIGIWEAIKTTTLNVVQAIVNFFTVTIPEAFNNFLAFVGNLATQVTTFFSNMWTGIVNFFTQTIPGWIDSVIQFFQKIPYYIGYMIGYCIGQFAQWGLDLWNFATVTIPEFISKIIEWFKQLPGKIWTWLVNAFNNVVKWGSNLIAKAKETGSNFINNVVSFFRQLPGKVWEWLTNTINKVISFGADLGRKGAEAGKKLFNSVIDGIKKLPGEMASIGKNLVEGLWNGIGDMVGWIGDKIKSFGKGVMDGLKSFFGIHSPSKETYWVGEMLTQGLGNAITNGTKAVVKKSKKMASNVLSTMKDNLSEKLTVGYDFVDNLKGRTAGAIQSLATPLASNKLAFAGASNNVNNVTFNQYNSSPKAIDSLETYRNTQRQLKQFEKWKGGK